MNEADAFYLSALPFLECDLHPKVASWVQSGCCLSRLTSIDYADSQEEEGWREEGGGSR